MEGCSAGADAVVDVGAFLLKGLEEEKSVAILREGAASSVSQLSDAYDTAANGLYMVIVLAYSLRNHRR